LGIAVKLSVGHLALLSWAWTLSVQPDLGVFALVERVLVDLYLQLALGAELDEGVH